MFSCAEPHPGFLQRQHFPMPGALLGCELGSLQPMAFIPGGSVLSILLCLDAHGICSMASRSSCPSGSPSGTQLHRLCSHSAPEVTACLRQHPFSAFSSCLKMSNGSMYLWITQLGSTLGFSQAGHSRAFNYQGLGKICFRG